MSQKPPKPSEGSDDDMRLNKYIAHCGIASRRAASELIKAGKVKVDGEVITNPGHRITPNQKITYEGRPVSLEERKEYILMNKPRDVITTVKDDRGRRTVIDLLRHKIDTRIYPVGRLDRNTTGLLLLTNDGDLAKKLSHPSSEIKKIYHVYLNRKFKQDDLDKLNNGLTLEDGFIKVDAASFVEDKPHTEVGVELHSGRNRIVRRMFEHLGYEVEKLDRVYFAGLTKKDLPRGKWRRLTKREVIMLKHFV